MLKSLKIKFAPLNIPIERILQTLATAAFIFIILFGTPTAFFLSLIIFIYGYQWMKLLLMGYLVFAYFDRNTCRQGGRRYVYFLKVFGSSMRNHCDRSNFGF